jgi:hypothetical protein
MPPIYKVDDYRYDDDIYKRCGNSGVKRHKVLSGLWHNFGSREYLVASLYQCLKRMRFPYVQSLDCGWITLDVLAE